METTAIPALLVILVVAICTAGILSLLRSPQWNSDTVWTTFDLNVGLVTFGDLGIGPLTKPR